MNKNFIVTDKTNPIDPNEKHPFTVLTENGYPVGLVAYKPFAVNPPPLGAKTAAILIVSSEQVSSEKEYPKILIEAYVLIHEAIDAEGVILTDEDNQVLGVLPRMKILEPNGDVQKKLDQYFRTRSQQDTGYQPMASGEPHVIVSTIYVCPVLGCSCPDINPYGWQKGREIPPCPIHNKPRQPKRVGANYAD
jgi:hypothetical protein